MDHLLAEGWRCLTVLDISGSALRRAQTRLPPGSVRWIEADVTAEWSTPPVDIWHDRAVFHFLGTADDRARYVSRLQAAVKPGGCVVIATFSPDGPEKCSGLPVQRYTPETLAAELGPEFRLEEAQREEHHTPAGGVQPFWFTRFVRQMPPGA